MRHILVTGANKGIGLAIVEAILEKDADALVFLGSRDLERGREAAAELGRKNGAWKERIDVLQLDVSSDVSVVAAAKIVADKLDREKLYGIVNNAGIGSGANGLADVLNVNAVGIHRVLESFLPLVEKGGRIVNVTSAAGPSFVATCSAERQRFFLDANASWEQLRAFIDECVVIGGDEAAFAAKGLGNGEAYGLSKACANLYTLIVAREHPELQVNACTPGFIETDMTRKYVLSSGGKSAADMGMKPPSEGARAPLHLLFGKLEGTGRYYGSDAQRSPLDRYRSPGSAPYTGS